MIELGLYEVLAWMMENGVKYGPNGQNFASDLMMSIMKLQAQLLEYSYDSGVKFIQSGVLASAYFHMVKSHSTLQSDVIK